jgi:hypothetical protein
VVSSSISPPFGRLSQSRRQVTYVLLTRAPLYSWSCPHFLARLACVRHAASVRSEPGSNSPLKFAGLRAKRRPKWMIRPGITSTVDLEISKDDLEGALPFRESVRYCLVFKDLRPLAGNQPYKPCFARVSISAPAKNPTISSPVILVSTVQPRETRASASSAAPRRPPRVPRAHRDTRPAPRGDRSHEPSRRPCRRRDTR